MAALAPWLPAAERMPWSHRKRMFEVFKSWCRAARDIDLGLETLMAAATCLPLIHELKGHLRLWSRLRLLVPGPGARHRCLFPARKQ